jgi:hypothetical protein
MPNPATVPAWFCYNQLGHSFESDQDLDEYLNDRIFLAKVIQRTDERTGLHITELVSDIIPDRLFVFE